MNRRGALLLALAALIAGALGDAAWQKVRVNRLHAAIGAARTKQAALERKTELAERLIAKLVSARAGKPQGPAAAPAAGSTTSERESPRTQALLAGVDLRYRRILAKLGWSSEKIGQFEKLNVAHGSDVSDILAAAQEQGLTPDDPAIAQIIANASPEYQAGEVVMIDNVDWNSVLSQAASVLSAPQMAALQSSIADAQNRSQLKILVSQLNAGKP